MKKNLEKFMKKGLALILAAGMAFSSPTDLLAKEVISKEPETVEQEELQIGEQEPSEETQIGEQELSEETQIEKQEPSTEPSNHALGYRPIDIKPERSELAESLESLQSLESSYRSPYVTKVKDQGNYGTCWAHAIAACAESSMLKKGLVTKEEDDDFSERHLSYYICNFKDIEDPLETAKGDYMECKVYDEKGKSLDPTINGGSYFEGSLFLMAYRGLASEMDYPYPDNYSLPSLPSTTEDLYGKNVAELTGVDILDISQTSVVKQAIKDYGAVAVSYYHSDAYESSDESSYYCYLNQAANHGVTLVGWDDDYPASNFKRKPENNGAWLIKNSWGEKYGDNGYCWISYEDKTLCDVYAFDFDSPDKYDNNYIYSGGLINTYDNEGSSYSNVYEIQGDNEVLKACGIFVQGADVNYSLQLYKNPEKAKDPESGEELFEEPLTGSFLFGGYHTVTLPDPVRLSKGDTIAIVFTLSKEDGSNCNICLDTTYTYSDKLANYNYVTKESKYQSFYKNRLGWHDYYSLGKTARINALTKNVKESISDAEISFVNGTTYTYTGSPIEPELKLTIGDYTLIKDTDYTVEYENNTDAGFKNPLLPSSTDYPKAIVKGKGAYASEETRELNFTITPLILTESSEGLTITPDEVDYSPKGNEPEFTLTYKGNVLKKGKDYTVLYKNTESAAKGSDENPPTATITGIKNYLGTLIKKTYTINRRELLSENIDYEKEVDFTDKDSKVVKSVTVDGVILTEDSDYKVTYAPLVESGNTASATVEGLSNYSGNVTINYDIRSVDAKSLEVELLDAKGNVTDSFEYTGSEIKPAVNVMLSGTTVDESNYTLSYKNNIDKADKDSKNPPTVTVSGKGIIQGSKEVSFNIVGKVVTDENIKISLDQESFSYDGEEKKPLPTVTFVENDKETLLTEGTDYELSYENNINAANADAKEGPRLILTFMGEYSGTINKAFTILPRDIGSEDISMIYTVTWYYTGSEIKPEVTIKDSKLENGRKLLKENEDYTVSYSNNIEVSTGAEEGKTPRVDISGIGNYSSGTGFDFEILAAPEGLWVENVEASKYTGDEIYYTGKAQTIAGLKVYWNSDLLTLNEDYTIKYANNKNAYDISSSDLEDKKAPSFTITGKGNYKDKLNSKKVLFTINPKAIEDTFSDEVYMTLKAGKLQ
nr:hypothetical protein [Lachnospiraceae bacterium]